MLNIPVIAPEQWNRRRIRRCVRLASRWPGSIGAGDIAASARKNLRENGPRLPTAWPLLTQQNDAIVGTLFLLSFKYLVRWRSATSANGVDGCYGLRRPLVCNRHCESGLASHFAFGERIVIDIDTLGRRVGVEEDYCEKESHSFIPPPLTHRPASLRRYRPRTGVRCRAHSPATWLWRAAIFRAAGGAVTTAPAASYAKRVNENARKINAARVPRRGDQTERLYQEWNGFTAADVAKLRHEAILWVCQ